MNAADIISNSLPYLIAVKGLNADKAMWDMSVYNYTKMLLQLVSSGYPTLLSGTNKKVFTFQHSAFALL